MAKRWSVEEEKKYRSELHELYVEQNKTIGEIAVRLHIAYQTVYDRLLRLGIKSCPEKKEFWRNKRADITIPNKRSPTLAELFGVLLGDGHVDHFQVFVNLGTKEYAYAEYVSKLMKNVFGVRGRISTRGNGHRDVYIGSTTITNWLFNEGMVRNKVRSQVGAPRWLFQKKVYMKRFLRGFFDTDGSVYRLRYGVQLSFTNKSLPLLRSLQRMLAELGYRPSAMSAFRVYVTHRDVVDRFFREIRPANIKHQKRYGLITKSVGTQAVNEGAL